MGLDNFPRNYPCKTQGTAITIQRTDREGKPIYEDDGSPSMSISCENTQACGGCPYKNAYEKSGLTGGSVTGMFGTDCWYRGKWGNALLDAIGYSDSFSFYGDNEDGTEKSPQSCREVAQVIDEAFDECEEDDGVYRMNGEDITDDLKYASWYLKWASEQCDGLGAWY